MIAPFKGNLKISACYSVEIRKTETDFPRLVRNTKIQIPKLSTSRTSSSGIHYFVPQANLKFKENERKIHLIPKNIIFIAKLFGRPNAHLEAFFGYNFFLSPEI